MQNCELTIVSWLHYKPATLPEVAAKVSFITASIPCKCNGRRKHSPCCSGKAQTSSPRRQSNNQCAISSKWDTLSPTAVASYRFILPSHPLNTGMMTRKKIIQCPPPLINPHDHHSFASVKTGLCTGVVFVERDKVMYFNQQPPKCGQPFQRQGLWTGGLLSRDTSCVTQASAEHDESHFHETDDGRARRQERTVTRWPASVKCTRLHCANLGSSIGRHVILPPSTTRDSTLKYPPPAWLV